MLYPRSNPFRQVISLPPFWDFRFDPQDEGQSSGWQAGFSESRPIAVPASWNEQFASDRENLGPAWYQVTFDRSPGFQGQMAWLRFGSVNYLCDVWLNGKYLGGHEGGHLPFEFDVTGGLQAEGNRLVVRVDGQLAPDRVPPGNISPDPKDTFENRNYPDTSFDFFPYCGIQRPVVLYSTPPLAIRDLGIVTEIQGDTGLVRVDITILGGDQLGVRCHLTGHGAQLQAEASIATGTARVELEVPAAALWAPGSPHLYDLAVELLDGTTMIDSYSLPVGIRTVEVVGDSILLNGRPVRLLGFGRHEDFPISGRGWQPAVMVKDYALMEWVGANSFRTTHYPYSEEMMELADRLGFLVIDETPAVGLFFRAEGLQRRLELCRQYTQELIARDRNHPSVIMWSLANEPHSNRPEARPFFQNLYELTRSLDPTRPVTVVSFLGVAEESFEFLDVVCLNRYYGWYSQPGQIDLGTALLEAEIESLHERYPKPLIVTEFGVDTIPGQHAQPPEMFSEEYQAEFLTRYIEILDRHPFVVGQHVWNLCDFKTSQAVHRVGGFNYKGVFTRDRRPKLAAHRLRQLWKGRGE